MSTPTNTGSAVSKVGSPGTLLPRPFRQPALRRAGHPLVGEVAAPLVLGDLVPAALDELHQAELVEVRIRLASHRRLALPVRRAG